MSAPAWVAALPREQPGRVGAFVEDGVAPHRAEHVDAYEIRMGSQETLNAGYIGVVMVTPERLEDPSHLVRATRMQIALQMLADLGVKPRMMGGLVVLEARWR